MIEIPVSIGEVFDKISILQIKAEKIKDQAKLKNVQIELDMLLEKTKDVQVSEELLDQLKETNQKLWTIEDRLRVLEKDQDFGLEFVELARNVYITNDQRASIKKQINEETGSTLTEEKSYA